MLLRASIDMIGSEVEARICFSIDGRTSVRDRLSCCAQTVKKHAFLMLRPGSDWRASASILEQLRIRVSCIVRMLERAGDICCKCIRYAPLGEKWWTTRHWTGDCFPDRREIEWGKSCRQHVDDLVRQM